MTRGRWTLLIAAVVTVGALWYLQAPPRTEEGYAGRAAETAASLRSQVETARIWVETVAEGRTLLTAAAVGLEEADGDAATILADFEQLDPPDGTAAVRKSVSSTGRDAVTLLGAVRIAAQDGEWERVEQRRDRLARMGERLDALEREARP